MEQQDDLESLPDLGSKLTRAGGDALLIKDKDLLVLHQDLALADGCIDGGIDQAEEQVPEEVVVVERSGRLVVEDGKVCGATGGDLAKAKPELPLGDLRIVVQAEAAAPP